MIQPDFFLTQLAERDINFFTGVPDSLLKEFGASLAARNTGKQHIIAANEGGAIALASGYYLATGKPGLVYMQNSGTGNAINPLLSLADPAVYSIPMLIVIGWRGEPQVKDEPQHIKQGQVQEQLLQSLEFPYEIMAQAENDIPAQLDRLCGLMRQKNTPVILLVRKDSFGPSPAGQVLKEAAAASAEALGLSLQRETALSIIMEYLKSDDKIVSTTGMASREVYELRDARGQNHDNDFLTVGSMGHSIMIALGLALNLPESQGGKIFCIDGDGAAIMHLGNLAISGHLAAKNLCHIVLNNGAHDSVGAQPTIGLDLPFDKIASLLGYTSQGCVSSESDLRQAMQALQASPGPHFLEVRVKCGARKDLGRPKSSPVENKTAFMDTLGSLEKPNQG